MRPIASHVRQRIALFVALVVVLALGRAVPAAAQATTGAITGTITDTQGGVLPGVTLTVTNTDNGNTRAAVTEADGQYRLAGLPPGRYDIRAELQGFSTVDVKGVVLTIGLEYPKDISMGVQTLQESVTVTGEAPVVETTKTEVGGVVTQEQISILPVQDRSVVNLALLMPGTGQDTARVKRPNASIGAAIGTASTNHLVDGVPNVTAKTAEPRSDIPQAAVREFAVHTTQQPAQYGWRPGGTMSVVTKSGTNAFTGEAFEFFRNQKMNRLDRFAQAAVDAGQGEKPKYSRDQFGGALGGPIVKNRLHFFATFEHTEERAFFTVAAPAQFYSAFNGSYRGGFTQNLSFVRGDYQITPNQNIMFRYLNEHTLFFCNGCGGTSSNFGAGDEFIPRYTTAGTHTWVVNNHMVNEVNWQWARQTDSTRMSKDYTPAACNQRQSVLGGDTLGCTRYVFPSGFAWGYSECLPPCLQNPGTTTPFKDLYEALSISMGSHNWKVGGAYSNYKTHENAAPNPLGTWTFGVDQYFNPADPNFDFKKLTGARQYQQTWPVVFRDIPDHLYTGFVQDEWKVTRALTLNLGVRLDYQTMAWDEWVDMSRYPRALPYVDFKSRGGHPLWQPRLGFAWDVLGNGRTVARGGFGTAYQVFFNGNQGNELVALLQNNINITNPSYPDPFGGRDPITFVSTAPPNVGIMANDIKNAPVSTSSLGFSQQLMADTAINVDGIVQRTSNLPTTVNVNQPISGTATRPLPAWGQITMVKTIGNYDYKALLVRLEKRLSHRYQYQVAYTLAKQDTDFANNLADAYDRTPDVGPAGNDRRHALVVSGGIQLPMDVVAGVIYGYRSTTPFNSLAGIDLNNDGSSTTDFVPGTHRGMGNRETEAMLAAVNAFRASRSLGPIPASQIDTNNFSRTDLRVTKGFSLGSTRKIELVGQLFNVFGEDNLGGIGSTWVTNATSSSFGQILTSQPRQQGEVAIRFLW
jgi:carboxypeptidase family protein